MNCNARVSSSGLEATDRHASEPEIRLYDATDRIWRRFDLPVETIVAHRIDEVLPALHRVQAGVRAGNFAAGFLSYEAASAFDSALITKDPGDAPLAWFTLTRRADPCPPPERPEQEPLRCLWASEWTPAEYGERIGRIRAAIQRGETYQVNATFRMRASIIQDPKTLFSALTARQQGAYSGLIQTPEFALLCASPELFFSRDGSNLVCRPMKGTCMRHPDSELDRAAARRLAMDPKNCAEHVMIVDMVRNDLGRVARTGTVQVERLFDVEPYPNVWQMTSTVMACSDADLPEIFQALFPSASITGAPKANTMRIIRGLERSPRGPYTGSLGFLTPSGRAQFNVAIRSVWINRQIGQAEFGVGGGIVWDSTAEEEYQECLRKASILLHPGPVFSLLETIGWRPETGYGLLDRHLARLTRSANALGFRCDLETIRKHLKDGCPTGVHAVKVRLILDFSGGCILQTEYLSGESVSPRRLRLARTPVSSDDLFLRHKTTRRDVYDAARAACPDCEDVLLWNERGELTETTTDNLILVIDGAPLTPSLSSGLLPGTCREDLLESGRLREAILTRDDLKRASAIYTINSVRGKRLAVWLDAGPG